ncbi:MAG: IS1634 family transposase, partial [Actinobacteria bacterium]|nr:IS1634 family transposase [Actinomycetota bacterium]
GSTADAKTIIWLLERLQKYLKISEITLVFDRGMVSDENLSLLEEAKIKYISAMDQNQLESITGLDFSKFTPMFSDQNDDDQFVKLPGFIKLKDSIYYREIKVKGERRYILCFNPQLFKDQRNARLQAVKNFHEFVENINSDLRQAKKSRQKSATYEKFKGRILRKKLNNFVQVELETEYIIYQTGDKTERNVRVYVGKVVVDEARMALEGKCDGFWLLVTNHIDKDKDEKLFKLPAQDAILPYRDKVVIESSFRDIKSFVEVSPVHVWTETHVKAHYTICVLSHLINRTLTQKLHKNPGELSKEIVTHEKFYTKLAECMIDRIEVENVKLSTYNMTRITEEQKELLKRVDLDKLQSREVVNKAGISSSI